MKALFAIACIAFAEAASACPTIPEEDRIKYADAVVDGVAICIVAKGTCDLRPTEVVKDVVSFGDGPNIYRLKFEPGAVKDLADHGELLMMCVLPWEPTQAQMKGRFYLSKRQGQWRVREGPEPPVQVEVVH